MTTRQDQHVEATWLGTTHAMHACATMHAKGMMDGRIASSAHAPEFLGTCAVLQDAWKASDTLQKLLHPAQQDEYFVGWVQGYGQRADEASDEIPAMLDTWEDDGGASAVPWFDVNRRVTGEVAQDAKCETANNDVVRGSVEVSPRRGHLGQ